MDMLTKLMITLPSTRSALRCDKRLSHRYARMVGSPASASPMEEYTGDREIESRRLTSLTDACAQSRHITPMLFDGKILAVSAKKGQ